MRGFLVGTLAVVALGVLGQKNAAGAVATGGNWFVSGLRRALSPDVAGVPQRGAQAAAPAAAAGGSGGGGGNRQL